SPGGAESTSSNTRQCREHLELRWRNSRLYESACDARDPSRDVAYRRPIRAVPREPAVAISLASSCAISCVDPGRQQLPDSVNFGVRVGGCKACDLGNFIGRQPLEVQDDDF